MDVTTLPSPSIRIPPRQFKARLSEKREWNDKFTQYFFELFQPNRFQFYAGQYISAVVNEQGLRRSYSICSEPVKEHAFELLLDIVPNGIGSTYFSKLEFGQEISFLAPLGMFTVADPIEEVPIVLIATGSGIAPFRSMVLDLLQRRNIKQDVTLFWGLRHLEEMFWQDEFADLMKAYPNFRFHPVISQALPEWPLCRGRVTDCLNTHDLPMNAHFYLCGSTPMILDVMKLLTEKGIPKSFIHHEKFS